jgi:hypothetical protein
MTDGLDQVRTLLPGVVLEPVETLGGSSRSVVRRVRAGARDLIVKQFTGAGEGWVRETAALSVLPPTAPTPRLVAEAAVPPVVVMSDVGTGPSVADALLGTDPEAAEQAVLAWARALATLHRTTTGARDAFRSAVAARAGAWPVAESTVEADLDESAGVLAARCADLDVDLPRGALDELRGLAARLGGDGPAALTPADACPDNNIRVGERLMLLDFESAQWRHLAWDLAYLRVPWPSCWCAWRLPDTLADAALRAYREVAGLPHLDGAGFAADLDAAEAGWAFITTSWFLSRALADDPPMTGPDRPGPNRRALILHRLSRVAEAGTLPALATLAGRLHRSLTGRWGAVPLAYAPAFSRTDRVQP